MNQVIFWFHPQIKYEFKERIMRLEKEIPGGTNVPILPWKPIGAGHGKLAHYEAILNKAAGSFEVDEIVERLWAEGCEVMYYPSTREQKQAFIIKEKKEV